MIFTKLSYSHGEINLTLTVTHPRDPVYLMLENYLMKHPFNNEIGEAFMKVLQDKLPKMMKEVYYLQITHNKNNVGKIGPFNTMDEIESLRANILQAQHGDEYELTVYQETEVK